LLVNKNNKRAVNREGPFCNFEKRTAAFLFIIVFLLVRPLNTLFNSKNDVKSRSAGAGFPVKNGTGCPATYGFVARTPSFQISSYYNKLLNLFNPILLHFSRFYTI
jgi:hypothetical protein